MGRGRARWIERGLLVVCHVEGNATPFPLDDSPSSPSDFLQSLVHPLPIHLAPYVEPVGEVDTSRLTMMGNKVELGEKSCRTCKAF